MFIALDVGNSRVALGFFERGRLIRRERFHPQGDLTEMFRKLLGPVPPQAVAVSSVAGERTETVVRACAAAFGCVPLLIPRDMPYPVSVEVPEPDRVGTDRIMHAAAVRARKLPGAIVADAGTALVVDLIGPQGAFLGGAIAPGQEIGARALHEFTARLPLVTPELPSGKVGRSTEECIRMGLAYSMAGLIDRLVKEWRAWRGAEWPLLLTGGAAPLARLCETPAELAPDLVLEGIAETYRAAHGGEA